MKAVTIIVWFALVSFVYGAEYVWKQQSPSGTIPSARFDFSYGFDTTSGNLIVFGGNSVNGSLNDLFLYNTGSNSWNAVNSAKAPAPRSDASSACVNGVFYLIGGTNGSYIFSDMWSWTSAGGWVEIGTFSNMQRYGASMVYLDAQNTLISFGGTTVSTNFSSDLMSYGFASNSWTTFTTDGIPPGRQWSSLTYSSVSNSLVVFGGWNGAEMQDLWLLDLETNYWHGVKAQASWPSARSGFGMTYNSGNGNMILFGGENPTASEGLNDLWTLDHESTPVWSQLTGSGGSILGRLGHCLVEIKKGSMVVFGGITGWSNTDILLNDLWTISVPSSAVCVVLSPIAVCIMLITFIFA